MKALVKIGLPLALVGGLVASQWPEIQRYLKIESM